MVWHISGNPVALRRGIAGKRAGTVARFLVADLAHFGNHRLRAEGRFEDAIVDAENECKVSGDAPWIWAWEVYVCGC